MRARTAMRCNLLHPAAGGRAAAIVAVILQDFVAV